MQHATFYPIYAANTNVKKFLNLNLLIDSKLATLIVFGLLKFISKILVFIETVDMTLVCFLENE